MIDKLSKEAELLGYLYDLDLVEESFVRIVKILLPNYKIERRKRIGRPPKVEKDRQEKRKFIYPITPCNFGNKEIEKEIPF